MRRASPRANARARPRSPRPRRRPRGQRGRPARPRARSVGPRPAREQPHPGTAPGSCPPWPGSMTMRDTPRPSGSARSEPSCTRSTEASVARAACAMSISSRRTPIQTLPSRSASGAWINATSGRMAGTSRIGSCGGKGLSITFQSGRAASRSLPRIPRTGRNGSTFSAACSALWIAVQLLSRIATRPARRARSKAGATPSSPSPIAAVSTSATQPAATRSSAGSPSWGTPKRRRPRARRRISSLTTATGAPA